MAQQILVLVGDKILCRGINFLKLFGVCSMLNSMLPAAVLLGAANFIVGAANVPLTMLDEEEYPLAKCLDGSTGGCEGMVSAEVIAFNQCSLFG